MNQVIDEYDTYDFFHAAWQVNIYNDIHGKWFGSGH